MAEQSSRFSRRASAVAAVFGIAVFGVGAGVGRVRLRQRQQQQRREQRGQLRPERPLDGPGWALDGPGGDLDRRAEGQEHQHPGAERPVAGAERPVAGPAEQERRQPATATEPVGGVQAAHPDRCDARAALAAALAILIAIGASGCGGGLKRAVDSCPFAPGAGKDVPLPRPSSRRRASSSSSSSSRSRTRTAAATTAIRRRRATAGVKETSCVDLGLTGRSAGDLLLLDRADALDVVLVIHDSRARAVWSPRSASRSGMRRPAC